MPRRRLFTDFARDLAAALEDVIEEDDIFSGTRNDDMETTPKTSSPMETNTTTECADLNELVKNLSQHLQKALTLSNKIRWKALSKSDGHYIPDDFFKLRKLITTALYPCVHRIKRVHIPALNKTK